MKYKLTLLLGLFIACSNSFAAKIDTIATYSDAMQKTIPAIVVTPDDYNPDKSYPVVYLLHGYSGDYTDWMNINGEYICKTADAENMIIVSPDGGYSSWYFDHPVNKEWQ